MTSQSSTAFFASSNPVKNGLFNIQRVPLGPASTTSRPITRKLVVTDGNGQVLHTQVLTRAKCTLGSGDGCTVRCALPGIAPVHALIVLGSKQMFVRTLAGKLSQDGAPAAELLLTEDRSYFDLAGYRFTVSGTPQEASEQQRQSHRLKFALSRPMSISSVTELQNARQSTVESPSAQVANLIREAIEPLEVQIESLLLPLAEFQTNSLQAQMIAEHAEQARKQAEIENRLAQDREISKLVAQQSASMDTLTERIVDVNHQLSTIERIIAKDSETLTQSSAETTKIVATQQNAIEQLQMGMVSVADSLKQLQERQQSAQIENANWKNEIQGQLQQLTHVVSEFSNTVSENVQQAVVVEAIESLKATHESAQLEIQRWQSGVQQQLDSLESQLRQTGTEDQASSAMSEAIAHALALVQSKHEASLQELHLWKQELSQEIRQMLQAAPVVQQTAENLVPNDATINPDAIQPIQVEPDTRLGMSSFSTVAESAAVVDEEPLPELLSDQDINRLYEPRGTEHNEQGSGNQSDLLDNSANSFHDWNLPGQDQEVEQAWPTMQFDSSENLTCAAPSDDWESDKSSGVIENVLEASHSEFNWALPSQPELPEPQADWSQAASQVCNFEPTPSTSISSNEQITSYPTEENKSTEFPVREYSNNEVSNLQLDPHRQAPGNSPANYDVEHRTAYSQEQFQNQQRVWSSQDDSVAPMDIPKNSELPSWWKDESSDDANEPEGSAQEDDESPSAMEQTSTDDPLMDISRLFRNHDDAAELLKPHEDTDETAPQELENQDELVGFGVENSITENQRGITDEVDRKASELSSFFSNITRSNDAENFAADQHELLQGHNSSAAVERSLADAFRSEPIEPELEAEQAAVGEDDESVEAYMKNLLARMRGESATPMMNPVEVKSPSTFGSTTSTCATTTPTATTASDTADQAKEPINFENYIPLTSAPESGKNISALRELANSTARNAIHKSTRRKTLSGSLMKLAISAIASTVAAALFAINGVTINIALIATMAAMFVALIWGYDGLKSLTPLLQNSLVLKPTDGATTVEQKPEESEEAEVE